MSWQSRSTVIHTNDMMRNHWGMVDVFRVTKVVMSVWFHILLFH